VEQLESRLAPAQASSSALLVTPGNPAIGTDPDPNNQTPYAPPNVAVANDAAGNFVEVWFSTANGNEVLAQRFDRLGNKLGSAITITSNYAPETQYPIPAVGMGSASDFVVAFDSSNGIFASRFDAAGNSLDVTPFQVDDSNSFEDSIPSVAVDDHGRFVVSWVGFTSTGPGVFARQGSASGSPALTPVVTVAAQSFSSFVFFQSASVSVDATGDFIVAYEAVSFLSASSSSVYAQRYDSSANALGSPIAVSTSGVAAAPSVAVNRSSGAFAVAWVGATTSPVLMAETFDANGVSLAGPFAVSPGVDPPSSQTYDTPTVAADSAGDFVAVWAIHGVSDGTTGSEPTGNLYAQRFDNAGTLTGNTNVISSLQNAPGPTGVAMDATGNYVVAYSASQQTVTTHAGVSASGNSYDIFAMVIPAFVDQTLSYKQSTFTANVMSGSTVTIAGSMAFFLKRDLGLSLPAGGVSQNFAAIAAKWLQGNHNSFGNTWYYITPAGLLFAWDGTAAGTGSTQVGVLDPVYYVYPDLLYNPSNKTFDYVLQQRLGLTYAANLYQNYGGQNEKWLKGSINNYGNPWYYIDTTGSLYSWDGTTNVAAGTLLAKLDTLYWAQPQRLYNAHPGEVTAAITNNELTVTTTNNWAGHEVVEVDNTAPASHQIFALTFVNQVPVLTVTPTGNQTTPNATPLTLTLGLSDADSDPVNVSALGGNLGFVLKQSLGLRVQGSLATNYGGQHEIWLQSTLNNWYFLKPDGTLYKWDGTLKAATGTQVAALDPVFYYHPDLLTNPSVGDIAYALDQRLNLTNTGNLFLNYGGGNEKWLLGNDGWYFVKPNGQLYKWDGTSHMATGTLMATLDVDYYTNIQRLYNAQPAQVAVGVLGNSLTLTPTAGFIGQLWIVVKANDTSQSVTDMVELTVTA
jgi:hypothetical protein